jgi:hypothetical protein
LRAGTALLQRTSVIVLLVALVTTACGPIGYTATILSASQALEEARQAGAAESAPYEYYYAQAHADKSREEAAEAEYQRSMNLAGTAREYAERARDLARRRARESGR